MHALAGQGVEVDRQGGGQRLALAGAHLGDLAVVQRDPAHQLDVEVAHLHDALARLADHGKGLGQQRVERFTRRQALAERLGLGFELVVAKRLELRLQRIDALNRLAVLLEQAVVAASEELGEEIGGHMRTPGTPSPEALARTAMIDRKDACASAGGGEGAQSPQVPANTRLSSAKPAF